jgi:hypothetical protein
MEILLYLPTGRLFQEAQCGRKVIERLVELISNCEMSECVEGYQLIRVQKSCCNKDCKKYCTV